MMLLLQMVTQTKRDLISNTSRMVRRWTFTAESCRMACIVVNKKRTCMALEVCLCANEQPHRGSDILSQSRV